MMVLEIVVPKKEISNDLVPLLLMQILIGANHLLVCVCVGGGGGGGWRVKGGGSRVVINDFCGCPKYNMNKKESSVTMKHM